MIQCLAPPILLKFAVWPKGLSDKDVLDAFTALFIDVVGAIVAPH